jgi:hypothetical protein
MSYLSRLARRSVQRAARSPGPMPIEPRTTGRFEPGAPVLYRGEIPVGPVEPNGARAQSRQDPIGAVRRLVHAPIQATAVTWPSPELQPLDHETTPTIAPLLRQTDRPRADREPHATSDLHPAPAEGRARVDDATGSAQPLSHEPTATGTPADHPSPPPSPVPEPPHLDTRPHHRVHPERGPTTKSSAEPRPPADASPALGPVIEILHAPGPLLAGAVDAAYVPSSARGAGEQPMSRSARNDTPQLALTFQPREPLGPLGLEPMRVEEILDSPRAAQAVPPGSAVQIHIGRVVVSRPAAPSPPSSPPRRSLLLSLDDYLEQRRPMGSRRGGMGG